MVKLVKKRILEECGVGRERRRHQAVATVTEVTVDEVVPYEAPDGAGEKIECRHSAIARVQVQSPPARIGDHLGEMMREIAIGRMEHGTLKRSHGRQVLQSFVHPRFAKTKLATVKPHVPVAAPPPATALASQIEVSHAHLIHTVCGRAKYASQFLPELVADALVRVEGENPLIAGFRRADVALGSNRLPGEPVSHYAGGPHAGHGVIPRATIHHNDLVGPLRRGAKRFVDAIGFVKGGNDDGDRNPARGTCRLPHCCFVGGYRTHRWRLTGLRLIS